MYDATLPMQEIQTQKQLPHDIFHDPDRESVLLEFRCLKPEMMPMNIKHETGMISIGPDMTKMIKKLHDVLVARMGGMLRYA